MRAPTACLPERYCLSDLGAHDCMYANSGVQCTVSTHLFVIELLRLVAWRIPTVGIVIEGGSGRSDSNTVTNG
jgi:hypothetical protein